MTALTALQDQAQRLQALEDHIRRAQHAKIEWPGNQGSKMARPFDMVSRGYLGADMASLSLFLQEYAGEISQLHTSLQEVCSRAQTRDESFSARLDRSLWQSMSSLDTTPLPENP